MQRGSSRPAYALGTALAHPLLYLLARVFGARAVAAFALALTAALLVFGVGILRDHYRLRALKRRFCDDAILYARKQRQVDVDPDFTAAELAEMRRLRRRLDVHGIHSLISSSNRAVSAARPAHPSSTISPAQRKLLYVGT